MQMPGSAFGGYPAAGRDYGYYSNPVKRQRTSMDFGPRGVYDADGRMRQVEAYPQAAAMYSNPPGAYQTPMVPGYPTGHAGVPDYSVRLSPGQMLGSEEPESGEEDMTQSTQALESPWG